MTLIEIKCPNVRTSKKYGKSYKCDKVAVKVAFGSRGEAYCHRCHQTFEFEVEPLI